MALNKDKRSYNLALVPAVCDWEGEPLNSIEEPTILVIGNLVGADKEFVANEAEAAAIH